MSDLVGNPEDRFSQNEAHFIPGHEQALSNRVCYLIFIGAFLASRGFYLSELLFLPFIYFVLRRIMNLQMHLLVEINRRRIYI